MLNTKAPTRETSATSPQDEYLEKYLDAPTGNDSEELGMLLLAIQMYEEETGQEYFPPETRKDKERKAR